MGMKKTKKSERKRAVKFYRALKRYIYRCSDTYARECAGIPAEKTGGYTVTLSIKVPSGMSLDAILEDLGQELDEKFRYHPKKYKPGIYVRYVKTNITRCQENDRGEGGGN